MCYVWRSMIQSLKLLLNGVIYPSEIINNVMFVHFLYNSRHDVNAFLETNKCTLCVFISVYPGFITRHVQNTFYLPQCWINIVNARILEHINILKCIMDTWQQFLARFWLKDQFPWTRFPVSRVPRTYRFVIWLLVWLFSIGTNLN